MKTVYTATKSGYGLMFEGVFNSLEELKRAVVKNSTATDYYSEELFERYMVEERFVLYTVDLHDDEEIVFHPEMFYDHGDSWFTIEKKDQSRFSVCSILDL